MSLESYRKETQSEEKVGVITLTFSLSRVKTENDQEANMVMSWRIRGNIIEYVKKSNYFDSYELLVQLTIIYIICWSNY